MASQVIIWNMSIIATLKTEQDIVQKTELD
jgi:hypothetical protein